MVQNTPNAMFNQASLDGAQDRLQELKLEEGRSTTISFIENIPGMPNPPFVYCKVHWNSEMGENGRMFQCFGGSCCQQVTWQKGWGGAPGKFDVHKARTRYYIPIIHYEQDPTNPIAVKATVKYLNLTWSAYDVIVKVLKNTNQGLSFFERDAKIEAQKINGALIYQIYLSEGQAQWLAQPAFKEQVESQLPEIANKLLAAMPKMMTEAEFLEMKPMLDKKVQDAISSRAQNEGNGAQAGFSTSGQGYSTPNGFSPIPQNNFQNAMPAGLVPPQTDVSQQPAFTQPQVNIPIQAQPVQQVQSEQQVQQPTTNEPAQEFEVPSVDLNFDVSQLLK